MVMISWTCFKSRRVLKTIFSVRIRSIQVPLPLKHVLVLIKLNKLNDCINDVNARQFGSILKPRRNIYYKHRKFEKHFKSTF